MYIASTSITKNSKDIEANFPLWAGVVALGLIIFAFIEFRLSSVLEQKKFVFPWEGPIDFQNWIT